MYTSLLSASLCVRLSIFLSTFLSGNAISGLMHLAAGGKKDCRDFGYGNAFDPCADTLSVHLPEVNRSNPRKVNFC